MLKLFHPQGVPKHSVIMLYEKLKFQSPSVVALAGDDDDLFGSPSPPPAKRPSQPWPPLVRHLTCSQFPDSQDQAEHDAYLHWLVDSRKNPDVFALDTPARTEADESQDRELEPCATSLGEEAGGLGDQEAHHVDKDHPESEAIDSKDCGGEEPAGVNGEEDLVEPQAMELVRHEDPPEPEQHEPEACESKVDLTAADDDGECPVVLRVDQWQLRPSAGRGRGRGRGRGGRGRGCAKALEIPDSEDEGEAPPKPKRVRTRSTAPKAKAKAKVGSGPKRSRKPTASNPASEDQAAESKDKEPKLVWELVTKTNMDEFHRNCQSSPSSHPTLQDAEAKASVEPSATKDKDSTPTSKPKRAKKGESAAGPSFARRTCPKTCPSKQKWECVRTVFKDNIAPILQTAGITIVSAWEAGTLVPKMVCCS